RDPRRVPDRARLAGRDAADDDPGEGRAPARDARRPRARQPVRHGLRDAAPLHPRRAQDERAGGGANQPRVSGEAAEMPDTDILVAVAGPTGLVLALWLARLGVRARIVDKAAEPGTTSRALAVQARTLELYQQIGLAGALVDRGRKALAANLWVAGRQVARAVLGDMGIGISPFPYALIFPQDEHERLLIDRLGEAGVEVERAIELVDFDDTPDGVIARLKRSDGAVETCRAAYLAGCDGAHSSV